MKVIGNISPEMLTVESYAQKPGYAEVRLRENVNKIRVTDSMTDEAVTMYEYDEYVFAVKDQENLRKDIESNMREWLATGRAMETDEQSSALVDSRRENEELLSDLAAMVDAVYESDLERIDANV